MIKLIRYFFFIFSSLFLFSCANQVTPQGGDKDLKPPKVTKSSPENYSTKFDSKKIELSFDEYMQLKDMNNQLIVSPPLSKTPLAKIHQKTLIIQIEDTLQPNTTYTLNFGNSIIDNNEGNVLENYQYVFSTGDVVDSLKISGKVENARDKKTEKGILVMLYKTQDDSLPMKKRPDYFAKTNDAGTFQITNIAPGSYKIFALKESNADYLFNLPDERIAFLHSPVESNASNITLELFDEKPKQHLLKAYSEEPGKAVVVFSQAAPDVRYKLLHDSALVNLAFVEESKKKDTLTFWYKNMLLDSLVLFFSDNATIKDTVTIRLFKSDGKTFAKRKTSLSASPNFISGGGFDPNKDVILKFSHPVTESDFAKISLKEDSVVISNYEIAFIDPLKKNLSIKHKWKEKSTYSLFIPPAAFSDLFGLKCDTLSVSFRVHQVSDYGTLALKMNVDSTGSQYLILLIDEKENVYRTSIVQSDTTLNYEFLDPMVYRLKIIEDTNRNGEWDTGNYLQNIQPEKAAYYPEIITVRANWDVEVAWKAVVGK